MDIVIFAGGAGTRLWPASRAARPKQLHALVGEQPLLVESVERLLPLVSYDHIYISTTAALTDACKELLPKIPPGNFIVEPEGRNTGPAVGLVTAVLHKKNSHAVIAALWSDHHIGRPEEFREVLHTAEAVVAKHPDSLVTIGISPTEPNTQLGYIQMNEASEQVRGRRVYRAKRFVEKPDYPTAKKYLASWQYLWNAGYFVFRADTMLSLFQLYAPEHAKHLTTIATSLGKPGRDTIIAKEFAAMTPAPIDTLIAEKVKSMFVIPADLDWSDIGSWSSLYDILSEKYDTDVIVKGHHIGHDDQHVLVLAHDKMIATVGLKDIIIVDTPDALLIANMNRAHDVKHLIEKLKREGKHLYV
jgi:mannose-1-phosphate guanylyltransferase